jgi:hypothetical protein
MSNTEPLKKGQEVFLKRPVSIYAQVIGPREGDFGLPAEQVSYAVQILPLKQYYLPDDLEPADQPQPKQARLESMSTEWVAELAHFNEIAGRWLANQSDTVLAKEVSESLVKLGFLV